MFAAAIVFKPSTDLEGIPGDVPGAPVIGHALEIMRDADGMEGWLAHRCETYGTASRIFLMGSDIVLLCGNQMAREIFTNEDMVGDADEHRVGTLGGGGSWLPLPNMVSRKPWSSLRAAIDDIALAKVAKSSFKSKLRDGARRQMYNLINSKEEGPVHPVTLAPVSNLDLPSARLTFRLPTAGREGAVCNGTLFYHGVFRQMGSFGAPRGDSGALQCRDCRLFFLLADATIGAKVLFSQCGQYF